MRITAEHRKALLAAFARFRERREVRRAAAIFQHALLAAIVGYLIYRLTQLGWTDVLQSLPVSPWFYVFFLLRFLALPVCEMAAYEINWERPLLRHFPVFVRKRVYNYAVAGYSGEGFLTLWARRTLGLSDRDVIVAVKDNNLLSALTSNVATVLLIIALAVTGVLQAELKALPGAAILFGLSFATAGALSVIVVVFRRRLIALPDGKMSRMLALHAARQVLVFFLQAAMYAAAIPTAPFLALAMFVTLQLVVNRIPFLPNQELVYLGAALTLAGLAGAPETAVAAMLIAEAGLSQALNIGLFFATAHLARQGAPAPAPSAAPSGAA